MKSQNMPWVGFEATPPVGDQKTQFIELFLLLKYTANLKLGTFDHLAILAHANNHSFVTTLK